MAEKRHRLVDVLLLLFIVGCVSYLGAASDWTPHVTSKVHVQEDTDDVGVCWYDVTADIPSSPDACVDYDRSNAYIQVNAPLMADDLKVLTESISGRGVVWSATEGGNAVAYLKYTTGMETYSMTSAGSDGWKLSIGLDGGAISDYITCYTDSQQKCVFHQASVLEGAFQGIGGTHTGEYVSQVAAAAQAYSVENTNDSNAVSWDVMGDGDMRWGDSSSITDVVLERSAANTLEVTNGHFVRDVQTLTATSLTLDDDDYVILVDDDTAGSTVTITLPALASSSKFVYHIKKLGTTANVVIDGSGAETIDGATTITMSLQYESVSITNDGSTEWSIF